MLASGPYLLNLLATFATTIASRIDEEVAKIGCRSHNAATALVTIGNHPGDSIEVLSNILSVTHSGAVRLINGLEDDKLVERQRSGNDGRSVVVKLTKEGRKVAKQVLHARACAVEAFLGTIGEERQAELEPILEMVLEKHAEGFASARWICRLCDESVCRPKGCPVEISACQHQ